MRPTIALLSGQPYEESASRLARLRPSELSALDVRLLSNAGRRVVVVTYTALATVGCAGNEVAVPTTVVTTSEAVGTQTEPSQASTQESGQTGRQGSELRLRGHGDARLPPFRVPRGGSVLRWNNSGEVFSLFSRKRTVVDSVAPRGEIHLARGVYRLDVIASGRWVVTIPGARPVMGR
jgi:hypothetical protein